MVSYIAAHCPTAGAIDEKKSSGSRQIVELGLCGIAVRLSIYNVIGYRLRCRRLFDGDGSRHRCDAVWSGCTTASDNHHDPQRRRPTDWLTGQFSTFIIIVRTVSASAAQWSVNMWHAACEAVRCGTVTTFISFVITFVSAGRVLIIFLFLSIGKYD